MMKRVLGILLSVSVAVLVFVACDDDGGDSTPPTPSARLTVQEYATRFDALLQELRLASQNAQGTVTARGETLDTRNGLTAEEKALLHDILGVNLAYYDGLLDGLAGIEPPEALDEAHDAYVAANEELRGTYREIDNEVDTTNDPNNLLKRRDQPAAVVGNACQELAVAVQAGGVGAGVAC